MRSRVFNAIRIGVLVLILAAVGVALWRNWTEVSSELGKASLTALAEAFVLALLSPLFTMLGWRVLLGDLGSRLHHAEAASVFFVGQLGKYLPGSVWTVVAQTDMAARLSVPRRRTAVVGLVLLFTSVLCGGLVGLPAVPLVLKQLGIGVPAWVFVVLGGLALLVMVPAVLNRVIAMALRRLRREPLEQAFTARALILALCWFVLAWLVMGAAVWVLAHDLGPPDGTTRHILVVTVSGFALAGIVGMLGFLVPAGVGIRDGLLIVVLGTVLPVATATAVVILSRFLTVVTDVLVALAGWTWGRRHHLLGSRT
ncbi:MAG: lysylphosphatidylglycerol synthase domain-containing protein [Nostocoides sp.]